MALAAAYMVWRWLPAGLRKSWARCTRPWHRAQAVVVAGRRFAAVAAGVRRLQHPARRCTPQSARSGSDLNGRPLRLFSRRSGLSGCKRPQCNALALSAWWWVGVCRCVRRVRRTTGLAAMLPVRGADWRGPAIHSGRKTTRCGRCAACPESLAALRCAPLRKRGQRTKKYSLRTLRSNWRYTASLWPSTARSISTTQVASPLQLARVVAVWP